MPEREPVKIYRIGGRSFTVCREYDEQLGESYPVYPDFEKHPEYTAGGRPFKTAEQESCPRRKPGVPGRPSPGYCGGCGWFHREETHFDPIGICMCAALRRENKTESEENK